MRFHELDKAFSWAKKYDLKILIDLHSVPMSQNGFDNGGLSGVCRFHQFPEEVEFVLQVLEKLAMRYGNHESLFGIQPLNEPISGDMWEVLDVEHRYPAVDKEMAKGSGPMSLDFLKQFYLDAYTRIRKHMPADKWVVFHDAFQLKIWKDFLTGPEFDHVMLDTHQYLMMAEVYGCEQKVEHYLEYIEEVYKKDFAEVASYIPLICGEWCMFNSYAVGMDTHGGQSVLNGQDYEANTEKFTPEEKKDIYRRIVTAQLEAWACGNGHCYWSYKTLLDTVNEPAWIGWDCWDLGKSADMGWFPVKTENP